LSGAAADLRQALHEKHFIHIKQIFPMNEPALIQIQGQLQGYFAPAASPQAPGVVVLMEAFGLTAHVEGLCRRLAAAGFNALAPDLYRGEQYSYADMDKVIAKLRALGDEPVMDDVAASLDWLRRNGSAQLAVEGFCMGGRLAFLAGCRLAAQLHAVISFYGGAIFPEGDKDRLGRTPPIHEAAALCAPLLLVYGGADPGIPPAEHGRLAQRLGELDKRYALSVYPKAGHGFCCEDRDAYAPQAAEAAHAEAIAFLRAALRA
jgi:carboxymethylenebutenolidase